MKTLTSMKSKPTLLLNSGVGWSGTSPFLYTLAYQNNYAQRSESFIRGHFSEKTAKEIFNLKNSSSWQGPIVSPYGLHIIKLSSISEAKQRNYNEVRDLVLKRFISEKNKEDLKLELEKKISNYQIIDK